MLHEQFIVYLIQLFIKKTNRFLWKEWKKTFFSNSSAKHIIDVIEGIPIWNNIFQKIRLITHFSYKSIN